MMPTAQMAINSPNSFGFTAFRSMIIEGSDNGLLLFGGEEVHLVEGPIGPECELDWEGSGSSNDVDRGVFGIPN